MRYLYGLIGIVVFGLVGCSEGVQENMTLELAQGDTREYQYLSIRESTSVDGDNRGLEELTHYVRYEVNSSDDEVVVQVSLEFMDGGSSESQMNRSDAEQGEAREQAQQVMADGYEQVIIAHTGKLDQSSVDSEFVEQRRVISNIEYPIEDVLSRPGLIAIMDLREGESHTFASEFNLPDFLLTIEDIDGETAHLSLVSTRDEVDMEGQLQVNIETGWLERAAVVVRSREGGEETVRRVGIASREDSPTDVKRYMESALPEFE